MQLKYLKESALDGEHTISTMTIRRLENVEDVIAQIVKRCYAIKALGFEPKTIIMNRKIYEGIAENNFRVFGITGCDEIMGLSIILDEDYKPGFKILCDATVELIYNPNKMIDKGGK